MLSGGKSIFKGKKTQSLKRGQEIAPKVEKVNNK